MSEQNQQMGPDESPRVRKFTPEGEEVEMDDAEHRASLRAFQKQQAWREEDERRRAIFGSYGEIVSVVKGDVRFIGIGEQIYHAPTGVDPINFFSRFATTLLSDKWQAGSPADNPGSTHPIAEWVRSRDAHFANAKADADGYVRLMPNGAMIALARLGYEAFIVQNNTEFRDEILKKLRVESEFYGARHELSVGAFLTMAGFHVQYLAEDGDVETPDMTVTHKDLGVHFTVEAKRKHRERGEARDPRQPDGSWKLAMRRPLRKAMKQVSQRARPWMICVDLDLPCPIPEPSDKEFLDTVVSDLTAIERQWTGKGGAPEMVLLIQLPYHSVDDYEPWQRPQIVPVASPNFKATGAFNSLAPFLMRAQEQFPRMPFTWEELGDGPAGRALKTEPPLPITFDGLTSLAGAIEFLAQREVRQDINWTQFEEGLTFLRAVPLDLVGAVSVAADSLLKEGAWTVSGKPLYAAQSPDLEPAGVAIVGDDLVNLIELVQKLKAHTRGKIPSDRVMASLMKLKPTS